jgi:hypothetical protein
MSHENLTIHKHSMLETLSFISQFINRQLHIIHSTKQWYLFSRVEHILLHNVAAMVMLLWLWLFLTFCCDWDTSISISIVYIYPLSLLCLCYLLIVFSCFGRLLSMWFVAFLYHHCCHHRYCHFVYKLVWLSYNKGKFW